jgi:glycosyltransferase involved in cell wall biosynthesis
VSVSVALCTHNGAAYLAEQLGSILSGTVIPDEIVVSDDASTDDTVGIAERILGSSGVEHRILRNPAPLGVSRNFESAIVATTGDIVVLSDQDDVWEPDRLSVALDAFGADPRVLLHHSNAALVDSAGEVLPDDLFEALGISSATLAELAGENAFDLLLRRNLVTGATAAFRRELVAAASPFPAAWVHDEWLAIIAASKGRIRPEPRRLIRYRQHGRNQIGATRRTLSDKLSRVFGVEGGRTAGLAERAELLAQRLRRDGAPDALVARAEGKGRFEAARAALPVSRWARIAPVRRLARRGGYRAFASQGRLDVLRDLLQRRVSSSASREEPRAS